MGGTGWVGVQLTQIVLSELRPSALAKVQRRSKASVDVKDPLSLCGIPRFRRPSLGLPTKQVTSERFLKTTHKVVKTKGPGGIPPDPFF